MVNSFDPEHLAAILEAQKARRDEEQKRIDEGGVSGAMIDLVDKAETARRWAWFTAIMTRILILLRLRRSSNQDKKALNSGNSASDSDSENKKN